MRPQKLMLFTLISLIFIGLVTTPVFAGQSAALSIELVSGGYVDSSGKFFITHPTFTISINMRAVAPSSQIVNLTSVSFWLEFNDPDDILEVPSDGVKAGDLMIPVSIWTISYYPLPSVLRVLVDMPGTTQTVPSFQSGSIAEITFKLKETAPAGSLSGLVFNDADAVSYPAVPIQLTMEPGSIEVAALMTSLTLSAPSTATVENPITLSATLEDFSGNPIPDAMIDYYVDSQWIDSDDTDAGGVSSTSYTPTDVGILDIKAQYNGTTPTPDKYAGSNDTATIAVNLMDTMLSLEKTPWSIKVSEPVDLVATLEDEGGTPLGGQSVHFYVDSQEISGSPATTDSSGVASLEYTFNDVGYYEIKAEFLGTEKYNPSSDSVGRTVASVGTTLTLTVNPSIVKADEPITMNATLKDEGGTPLGGQPIHFYFNFEEIPGSPATTDSSGLASLEYRPQQAGLWLAVEARYNGSLAYTASYDMLSIWVFPIPTTLTLTLPPTATVDSSTDITATLEDEGGTPLGGQSVHFYVDSQEISGSPATTDSSGVASISYTPTAVGTFPVMAWYNESAKYDDSSDEDELEVKKLTTTLNFDVPTLAKVEDKITLTATLKDQDEIPIPASTIYYQIYSIGWNPLASEITNTNGTASVDYTPNEAGTFKIRAIYSGDEKHAAITSEEKTLTVNKIATTLTISVPPNATAQTSFTISAILIDEDGNLLSNSTIYYQIQKGVWIGIGSTQTNPNGVASMIYQTNEEGTFKLKATYGGDQKYAGSTSEEATLKVASETPEEPETPGEPWNPWGFLLDEDMTALDILFWTFVIVSFATFVVVIVWRKIK